MKRETLSISGMSCVACEMVIEKGAAKISGCEVHMVCHKTGSLDLSYEHQHALASVKRLVEKHGYSFEEAASDRAVQKRTTAQWIELLAIGIGVGAVLRALGRIDIYQYLPALNAEMGIGVALIIGLVASVSSCLAVTGGIVVGFSEYLDESKGFWNHLRVQGGFQLGRIAGFVAFGALLGALGSVIKINLGVQGLLNILIGVVFIYLGAYMVGLVPNITRRGFHLPKSWTSKLHTTTNPWYAPIAGALTFFLPCGFTQSMQLLAIGSGSPTQGALLMGVFALGTLPALLALGLGSSYIKEHQMRGFNTILGFVIFFFGFVTINNGWALAGSITASSQTEQVPPAAEEQVTYEEITVGHNGYQLVPETVELEAGGNYELTFLPEEDGLGCMSTLVIPRINRDVHRIVKGTPITYTLTDIKAGTYPVVCASMGMSQGKIVVN